MNNKIIFQNFIQEIINHNTAIGRTEIDNKILSIMNEIDREEFGGSYEDHPESIGFGQTISQPFIVALMTDLIKPQKDHKILEIGTGSGYQAAILAKLVAKVYTIERIKELAEKSKNLLKKLNLNNIEVFHHNGFFGLEEFAPYDSIIVTCAINEVPEGLLNQLKDNGKLVIPLGEDKDTQILTLITKKDQEIIAENVISVRFVPFIQ